MTTEDQEVKEISSLEKTLDELAAKLAGETSVIADPESEEVPGLTEEQRLSSKPVIDFMDDAIDSDGKPKFKVGDKIVIERYISLLPGKRWLDTRTYVVKKLNEETGDMDLEDPDYRQFVFSNYKRGIAEFGYIFKLTSKYGGSISRKRGRPRKNPQVPPKEKPLDANGKPIKGKRGRPKGTKNRDKAVILAEKQVKDQERKAKHDARNARKGKR